MKLLFVILVLTAIYLVSNGRRKREKLDVIEPGGNRLGVGDIGLTRMSRKAYRDLRLGLSLLIIGAGSCLVIYLIDLIRPYWPIGLVGVFVGLAYLVSSWVLSRRQRAISAVALKTGHASSQQAASEKPGLAPPVETSPDDEY